jgi:hypothetical protein
LLYVRTVFPAPAVYFTIRHWIIEGAGKTTYGFLYTKLQQGKAIDLAIQFEIFCQETTVRYSFDVENEWIDVWQTVILGTAIE